MSVKLVNEAESRFQKRNSFKKIKDKFLGKRVHVDIKDKYHHIDNVGEVLSVDDIGNIHGTWGGLAVVLPEDSIYVLENISIKDFLGNDVDVDDTIILLKKIRGFYGNIHASLAFATYLGKGKYGYEFRVEIGSSFITLRDKNPQCVKIVK